MEKTVEKYYIPKLNKTFTIECQYDNKTSLGSCNIYDNEKLIKSLTGYECGQLYFIIIKSYTDLIEMFYEKEDVEKYDILAINYKSDDIINLLTSKYELLDKIVMMDEIEPSIGDIKRIIFADNKIIALSTGVEKIYSTKLNSSCNIELSPEIKVLKTI